MVEYYEYNNNPKKRKTSDCVTRALAEILGIDWYEALTEQAKMSVKTGYAVDSKQVIDKVLVAHGWVRMKQPRKEDNTKYKVGEIDELVTKADMRRGIAVLMANHLTAVKNDTVIDIWDCRNKTISNYWIKTN